MVAGFAHAPITKGLIITTTITSVLASLFQLKPFLHLQLDPHLYTHHQWYRLLTQHFAFTNSSELLLALLLMYNAGVKVERTFGTYKFAGFLVVVMAMYGVVQVVALGVGVMAVRWYAGEDARASGWLATGKAPAGPFAPLFAILYQHHRTIPHLWFFRVGDLTLTDQHVQVYSLAMLLCLSQSTSTLFASLLAIAVSALYHPRLAQYRVPLRLYRIMSLLLTPWIGQTRVPQRSWRAEPPERRTLEARQARLAQHNAAVATVSGDAGARLASLLRGRRMVNQGNQTQQRAAARSRPEDARGGSAGMGWNDAPPPEARSGVDAIQPPSSL